jgi:hypothetical protein
MGISKKLRIYHNIGNYYGLLLFFALLFMKLKGKATWHIAPVLRMQRQIIFFHFFVQQGPVDPQNFGGPGLIVFGFF